MQDESGHRLHLLGIDMLNVACQNPLDGYKRTRVLSVPVGSCGAGLTDIQHSYTHAPMVTRDDVMKALGAFADSAKEGDIRLLTAELTKAKKEADKHELVKQFKKMIRNRKANATVVAPIVTTKKSTEALPPSAKLHVPPLASGTESRGSSPSAAACPRGWLPRLVSAACQRTSRCEETLSMPAPRVWAAP